jgi:hypothetical protein
VFVDPTGPSVTLAVLGTIVEAITAITTTSVAATRTASGLDRESRSARQRAWCIAPPLGWVDEAGQLSASPHPILRCLGTEGAFGQGWRVE